MTAAALLRKYWRVLVVGALGGLVALAGSFVIPPTYQSRAHLLLRNQDSTLLSNDGKSLQDQPTVVDSTLTNALGETQSALVSGQTVATMVVDKLHLDAPQKKKTGPLSIAKRFVAGTYKRTKAYLAHGFYKEPTRRQAAIQDVESGLSAAPLKDSYVLELTGSADEPQKAADITNAAADSLVAITTKRFHDEAAANRDFLAGQLERASKDYTAASAAISTYKNQNGIVDLPLAQQLQTSSLDSLKQSLQQTTVDLASTQAELDATNRSLASTPQSNSTESNIQTGRSSTDIKSTAPDGTYAALLLKRNDLEGKVASLSARQHALQGSIAAAGGSSAPAQEAQLDQLQQRLAASEASFQDLNTRFQSAVVNADKETVEVTRIDSATAPTFPVRPLRYMYLFLGLLCGAVAGFLLTLRSGRSRAVEPVVAYSDPPIDRTEVIDLSDIATPVTAYSMPETAERTQVGRFEVFTPNGNGSTDVAPEGA